MSSWIDVKTDLKTEQDLFKFREAIAKARAAFAAPKHFQSEEQLFEHIEASRAPLKTYPNNGPDAKAIEFVRKFFTSGELSMEVKGNSYKRRQIHEAATYLVKTEGFQISHESRGTGNARCIVLCNLLMMPKKKEDKKAEECGCLAEDPNFCICKEF